LISTSICLTVNVGKTAYFSKIATWLIKSLVALVVKVFFKNYSSPVSTRHYAAAKTLDTKA